MPKIDNEVEQFQKDLLNSIAEMKPGEFAAVHTAAQIEAWTLRRHDEIRLEGLDHDPAGCRGAGRAEGERAELADARERRFTERVCREFGAQ